DGGVERLALVVGADHESHDPSLEKGRAASRAARPGRERPLKPDRDSSTTSSGAQPLPTDRASGARSVHDDRRDRARAASARAAAYRRLSRSAASAAPARPANTPRVIGTQVAIASAAAARTAASSAAPPANASEIRRPA